MHIFKQKNAFKCFATSLVYCRYLDVIKSSHWVPLLSFRALGETGFLWQPKFVAGEECVGSSFATEINYFCSFRVCEIELQPTFASCCFTRYYHI